MLELAKNPLSPEAVKWGADNYRATGVFPITARSQAAQAAILNLISQEDAAAGKTGTQSAGEIAANKSNLVANERSLAFITKQKNAAEAYERGARAELQLARDNIPQMAEPLDMQVFIQWVRTGETKFGGTKVPKFMTYLISGLDEYAKVLSGNIGSGGSTDTNRAQALSLIPAGATTDQIDSIIDAMDQGMDKKINGYNTQIAAINRQIKGGASAPIQFTPGQEDADYEALASGTKFIGPDGHVRTKP